MIGGGDPQHFHFVVEVPGLAADYLGVAWSELYSAEAYRDLEPAQLRHALSTLPCCALGGDRDTWPASAPPILLCYLNADHWAAAIPLEEAMPFWTGNDAATGPFPRWAVLEAIVLYLVEELRTREDRAVFEADVEPDVAVR